MSWLTDSNACERIITALTTTRAQQQMKDNRCIFLSLKGRNLFKQRCEWPCNASGKKLQTN